jgi:hypothetical protein
MQDYWQKPEVIKWTKLLLDSYENLLGMSLLERTKDSPQAAQQLFFAPFIVLSHDTQASPILNYGNQAALNLWETDWETFTKMPSRQTVAPENTQEQETRSRMLKIVQEQGYITNYEGIRINCQGKLLKITEMTVWNIFDESHSHCGQGATCVKWSFLPSKEENTHTHEG